MPQDRDITEGPGSHTSGPGWQVGLRVGQWKQWKWGWTLFPDTLEDAWFESKCGGEELGMRLKKQILMKDFSTQQLLHILVHLKLSQGFFPMGEHTVWQPAPCLDTATWNRRAVTLLLFSCTFPRRKKTFWEKGYMYRKLQHRKFLWTELWNFILPFIPEKRMNNQGLSH